MKNVVNYYGNAEDILDPAKRMGWAFEEDKYVESDGCINWDKAIDEAVVFLRKKGVTVCYN